MPDPAPGFHDQHLPRLVPMLRDLVLEEGIEDLVAWVYTPMALPLAQAIEPSVLVYDCMDELSAFLHAPAELLARESELLARAELVFTGGPSLHRAKRDRHPSVHCFPSSVDTAHFRQAIEGGAEPPDQLSLPRPRLGFYGVIDERFDIPLLDFLAQARPDWQFMMIGPVAKIDPANLPWHSNIHYLGQRSYDELPSYLAGWDACLLPFARNEATRYISPTKTLEYMAAERPIVSTPIADVAGPYGDIVYLGATPQAFLEACDRALASDQDERNARIGKMRAVLARTSWDSTALAMRGLIEQVIGKK
jgi:UDP-galactopyranose mutase